MERHIRLDWAALVKEAVRRRKAQRFTQHQLSVIVGVSKPTLVDFEKGRLTIKVESALKILKALGLAF